MSDGGNIETTHMPMRRKWALWKWSLLVTGVMAALLMWQCGSALVQGRNLSNPAVQHFHDELNADRYDEIYREGDDGFIRSGKEEDLVKFLQAVHTKLGDAGAASLVNIRVNATTSGTFIVTQYNTTFARGPAVETFTWVKRSGTLKLHGYHIESTALVVS